MHNASDGERAIGQCSLHGLDQDAQRTHRAPLAAFHHDAEPPRRFHSVGMPDGAALIGQAKSKHLRERRRGEFSQRSSSLIQLEILSNQTGPALSMFVGVRSTQMLSSIGLGAITTQEKDTYLRLKILTCMPPALQNARKSPKQIPEDAFLICRPKSASVCEIVRLPPSSFKQVKALASAGVKTDAGFAIWSRGPGGTFNGTRQPVRFAAPARSTIGLVLHDARANRFAGRLPWRDCKKYPSKAVQIYLTSAPEALTISLVRFV